MNFRAWWKDLRGRRASRLAAERVPRKRPLREFVYLDEVSLRSLLVSQRDTIPEQVSRAISRAEEAEIAGKLSAGNDLVGKGEVGSRFQTSNSSSVQTSRKAVVQTLFKELRDDNDIPYATVTRTEPAPRFGAASAIASELDPSIVASATSLVRGSLVEIEVILEVDPVFKLATLASEYLAIVEEHPGMMDEANRRTLREIEPVNRVLQRLLAGLIPIRSTASKLCVVEVDGDTYIVRKDAIDGLDLQSWNLEIVGVTEHLGYWKDIRRLLFSSSEVTMLCRVARSGIQKSWTSVKLADLFREVSPDLVHQIDAFGRSGLGAFSSPPDDSGGAFRSALSAYVKQLESLAGTALSETDWTNLRSAISTIPNSSTPAAQRRAFAAVRNAFEMQTGAVTIGPEEDLVARRDAREAAGLPLFGERRRTSARRQPPSDADGSDHLIDVEVVAIYW